MKFVNAVTNGSSFFVDGKRPVLSFYAHLFKKIFLIRYRTIKNVLQFNYLMC